MRLIKVIGISVLFLVLGIVGNGRTNMQYIAHTEIQLISEDTALRLEGESWFGIDMQLDSDWHVYWQSPGDSGMPLKVEWILPTGFEMSDLLFPYPHRIDYEGLTSYGHSGNVTFLSRLKVPSHFNSEDRVNIGAHIRWLVCEKICLPAEADLNISLLIENRTSTKSDLWKERFTLARSQLPTKSDGVVIDAFETKTHFRFIFPNINNLSSLEYFSMDEDVVQHTAVQKLTRLEKGYELVVEKSEFLNRDIRRLRGVFVSDIEWNKNDDRLSIMTDLNIQDWDEDFIPSRSNVTMSIWLAIGFAFIGGLILNLMPCVFPVLSLKVLSLIRQSQSKEQAWKNGVSFTFGVLVSFWILVGIVMFLRGLGFALGWGFQFQLTEFVIFLIWLFFLIGLNLLGVFEFVMGVLDLQTQRKEGLFSSFLNGFLVTIAATPCTAPFMGVAIGFALTQSVEVAFLVFSSLAIGLACPYLLLSCFPAWLKRIPKSGIWMIWFKVFLGILLMLTVLWLILIVQGQMGVKFLAVVGCVLFLLLLGSVLLGLGQRKERLKKWRILAIIIIGSSLILGLTSKRFFSGGVVSKNEVHKNLDWKDYSPVLVKSLEKEGKPFFIDFTAKWCLSCQVNERFALHNKSVIRMFKEKAVILVRADWTSYDKNITKALASFGKTSIPFYVLYPGEGKEPIMLPEVITPSIVRRFLEEIKGVEKD